MVRGCFFFRFRGLSENELFKRYEFSMYRDAEELLSETYHEIEQILMHYIAWKACTGCIERQPNQMYHICTTETRTKLAKKYLTIALEEHPKYQVGDIADAFVDYEATNF